MFFTTVVTILPGRLLRRMISIKNETLAVKRSFVRLVSHEIRSPLNVAYGGLEVLKSDLLTLKENSSSVNDGR